MAQTIVELLAYSKTHIGTKILLSNIVIHVSYQAYNHSIRHLRKKSEQDKNRSVTTKKRKLNYKPKKNVATILTNAR